MGATFNLPNLGIYLGVASELSVVFFSSRLLTLFPTLLAVLFRIIITLSDSSWGSCPNYDVMIGSTNFSLY